jgi:AmmeMemoRadiSam system protein A
MGDKLELISTEGGRMAVQVARKSLEQFVRENTLYKPSMKNLPQELQRAGASFITLTLNGNLRGCMGHTDALYPLAEDIARNATAASRDFRFPSVSESELVDIRLEVTVLTPLVQLTYHDLDDLLGQLKPGIDGVMLAWKKRRGLLLPQVWRRVPDPLLFVEAIISKAGIPGGALYEIPPTVAVYTFQVQHFAETGYLEPGS